MGKMSFSMKSRYKQIALLLQSDADILHEERYIRGSFIFWMASYNNKITMVVSNILYFHPCLGKIPILTNIFQLGWNHQPD